MPHYEITVNGRKQRLEAEADTPLLWVLRDELALTGTKFGCGKSLCGACTVHLGGNAIRSCSVPISAVGAQSVVTIEGLSADGSHPLQKAWVEVDVPQCGYCQPGQIMQAAALLASDPAPSESAIQTAMRGNICRCGTYPRIKRAIQLAISNNNASPSAASDSHSGEGK